MAIFHVFINRRNGRPSVVGWILLALIAWFALSFVFLRDGSKSKTGRKYSETNPKFRKAGHTQAPEASEIKVIPGSAKESKATHENISSKAKHDEKMKKEEKKSGVKHEIDVLRPKPKEFPVKLLLEPIKKCKEGAQLLMIVLSQPEHFGARKMIRQSWGVYDAERYRKPLDIIWQTIFVMGRTKKFDSEIAKENIKHSDILQVDFEDNPYEDTRKFMSAIHWVTDRLPKTCHLRFIIKTEDNIFHNMIAINGWLKAKYSNHLTKDEHLYVGKLIRKDKPIRDPRNPLYIPKSDYTRDVFPDYIQGPVYLFSYYSYSKLTPLMKDIIPLAMEDAYVGLLVQKSGTIVPAHNDHFHLLAKPLETCHFLRMFFMYNVLPSEHAFIFKTIDEHIKENKCSDSDAHKAP